MTSQSDGAAWLLDPASSEDLEAILEIERISFRKPWTRDSFERELDLPFSRITAARRRVGERPVGYLCRWLVADEVHILNLAVHPEVRRRGLATTLLRAAIREGTGRGASVVLLEVEQTNVAARALYRSMGFNDGMVRRDYYRRGVDACVMNLRLPELTGGK